MFNIYIYVFKITAVIIICKKENIKYELVYLKCETNQAMLRLAPTADNFDRRHKAYNRWHEPLVKTGDFAGLFIAYV